MIYRRIFCRSGAWLCVNADGDDVCGCSEAAVQSAPGQHDRLRGLLDDDALCRRRRPDSSRPLGQEQPRQFLRPEALQGQFSRKLNEVQLFATSSHRYGNSHAICDHICHPAEVTFPPLS